TVRIGETQDLAASVGGTAAVAVRQARRPERVTAVKHVGVTVASAPSEPMPTGEQIATGALPLGLSWAVRRRFLAYLSRSAGGRAVLARGASVSPAHGITFPAVRADFDRGFGDGTAWFGGEV